MKEMSNQPHRPPVPDPSFGLTFEPYGANRFCRSTPGCEESFALRAAVLELDEEEAKSMRDRLPDAWFADCFSSCFFCTSAVV